MSEDSLMPSVQSVVPGTKKRQQPIDHVPSVTPLTSHKRLKSDYDMTSFDDPWARFGCGITAAEAYARIPILSATLGFDGGSEGNGGRGRGRGFRRSRGGRGGATGSGRGKKAPRDRSRHDNQLMRNEFPFSFKGGKRR